MSQSKNRKITIKLVPIKKNLSGPLSISNGWWGSGIMNLDYRPSI